MNTVPVSFIKGETFPEPWKDYRIFKNGSAPKSNSLLRRHCLILTATCGTQEKIGDS